MDRNEIVNKINQTNRQRALFLGLGIFLLVFSVGLEIFGGVMFGMKMYNTVGSNPNPDFNVIAHLYTSPEFVIPVSLATMCVLGGVALLVLRGVLIGHRLKRLTRELESEMVIDQ